MRWNIVGTMCVWVTRCSSINRSVLGASHRSMSTSVAPPCSGCVHREQQRRGVVQRAGHEVDHPGLVAGEARRGECRRRVLGRSRHALRPAGGPRGVEHDRAAHGILDRVARLGGERGVVVLPARELGASATGASASRTGTSAAAGASSGREPSITTACAPQSRTMYSASSRPRCQLTGVRRSPARWAAAKVSTHSGRFGAMSAIASPAATSAGPQRAHETVHPGVELGERERATVADDGGPVRLGGAEPRDHAPLDRRVLERCRRGHDRGRYRSAGAGVTRCRWRGTRRRSPGPPPGAWVAARRAAPSGTARWRAAGRGPRPRRGR